MTVKTTSERMGESFDRALGHWRRRHDEVQLPPAPPSPPAVTIAISRQEGAGATAVAEAVGAQLGWTVYDRELVERISRKSGASSKLLERVDEHSTSWLTDCLEAFSQAGAISSDRYVRDLGGVLLSLAASGDCVIVGRGAAIFLPVESTLRIRVIAPLKDRVARVRAARSCSEKEALSHIQSTDRQRGEFVRRYFHGDVASLDGYDLVINTSGYSIERCATVVVAALGQRREQLQQMAS